MAFWRYTEAAPDLSGLATASDLAAIDDAQRATSDALSAYLAEQNAGNSGGIAITDDFTGDDDTLPTETFIQDSQNALRRYQGKLAVWSAALPNQTRDYWFRSNIPLETDDQSIAFVLGLAPQLVPTVVYLRGTSDGSDLIYIAVGPNGVQLGRGNYNLGTHDVTLTPWITSTIAGIPNGARFELRATGTTYRVHMNGSPTPVIAHTDVSGYPIDASHRYIGGIMLLQDGIFQNNRSAYINSIAASDIALPTYNGVGWDVYRGLSTGLTVANGQFVLPVGTFTVIRDAYGVDTTKVATESGRIDIIYPGWYVISCRMHFTSAASLYCPILYGNANGPSTGTQTILRIGGDIPNEPDVQASWVIYLRAGAYVKLGVNNGSGASRTITGDAAGNITVFTGARLHDRMTV
ncbi:hypothetical protein ACWCPQ_34235 [Nocardia sp. NPDC001965]